MDTATAPPAPPQPTPTSTSARSGSPAGFWIRFAAIIVDSVVLFAMYMAVAFMWAAMFGADQVVSEGREGDELSLGLTFIFVLMSFGYYAALESSAWQGTLGKRAFGLVVGDEHGNRLSFGRALGRTLAKIVSGFILYIGYIMAAFTDRKQALHDMIATTYVTRR